MTKLDSIPLSESIFHPSPRFDLLWSSGTWFIGLVLWWLCHHIYILSEKWRSEQHPNNIQTSLAGSWSVLDIQCGVSHLSLVVFIQPHESRPRFIEQFPPISFTNDMGSNLSDASCNLHLLASQVVSSFTKLKCMSWKPGPSGGIFEKIHHQPPDSNVEKLWL